MMLQEERLRRYDLRIFIRPERLWHSVRVCCLHKELLALGGIYNELYETQFSKALIEEDGVSELEQYIWGTQPADEPFEE